MKYFIKGFSDTFATYKKKKGNFLSLLLMSISSVFGKLLFFTAPLFKMNDLALGEMAAEENDFNMFEAFRDSDDPRSSWILVLITIVQGLLILSGLIIIGLFGVALYSIAVSLDDASRLMNIEIWFTAPIIVIAVLYVWFMGLIFAPATYITVNTEEKNLFNVLYNLRLSIRFKNIANLILIDVICFIALIIGPAILMLLLFSGVLSIEVITPLSVTILGAIYVYFSLFVLLHRRTSIYLCYKDNVCVNFVSEKLKSKKENLSDEEALTNVFAKSQV